MIHDLKTLILSFHPIVVIETVEEQRANEIIARAAEDLSFPCLEWSTTRGLSIARGEAIQGTATPEG